MDQGAFRRPFEPRGRRLGPLRADPNPGRARTRSQAASLLDQHRALFEFAPDGYLTTDGAGRIQQANRVAGALLHVRQANLAGRPLARFISEEDRGEFRSRLAAIRRSGRLAIEELRIRVRPLDGEIFDAALTGAKLPAMNRRVVLAWSLRDIRKRTRVERRLKESEQRYLALYHQMLASRDELRILADRFFRAREEESRRIARELHDEAGQMTTSIHLALAEIGSELPEGDRGRLETVHGLLDALEERLRRLSHELRPTILDDLGLRPALEFLTEGFAARTGIASSVEGSTKGRLEPLVETAVYRIVQEALTNIARHAGATHASIRISRQPKTLRCSIRDDGVGMPINRITHGGSGRRGLGLLGIRERLDALGGKFELRSRPGGGTEVFVKVPIRGAE
jgi:two-component system sensor histidine kinase UhpB